MPCDWEWATIGWGCRTCGRVATYRDVESTCPGGGGVRRYAFWPRGGSSKFHSAIVFPFNFYVLPTSVMAECDIPHEEAPADDSRVGTQLKSIFKSFGIKSGNCNCERLAGMMDSAGLDFLRDHIDGYVDLVAASAAQMGIPAPKVVLKRLLAIAIWRERRCQRNSDG